MVLKSLQCFPSASKIQDLGSCSIFQLSWLDLKWANCHLCTSSTTCIIPKARDQQARNPQDRPSAPRQSHSTLQSQGSGYLDQERMCSSCNIKHSSWPSWFCAWGVSVLDVAMYSATDLNPDELHVQRWEEIGWCVCKADRFCQERVRVLSHYASCVDNDM